jgi:probable F420-dependent oxidoreductase
MTSAMRPFRFIAAGPHRAASASELADYARRAEDLGYHSLVLADHLLKQHAPIPLLATVAATTTTLRVGTFVLNNSLRHPAVLAQEMASLSILSGGRVDIGIGAGWNRPEYEAIGLPYPSARTRVAQLTEAVAVLKGCFAPGPFSFAGEHYTMRDFDGVMETPQRPHPPFFIGGGGRRVLTLAGHEADIVGLAPRIDLVGGAPTTNAHSLTAAATEEKLSWVREAAGDRYEKLDLNTYPSGDPVIITDNPREAAGQRADRLEARTGVRLSIEEVLDSPHVFIGSPEMLIDKITGLRERFGINSFMLGDIDDAAPVVAALSGR